MNTYLLIYIVTINTIAYGVMAIDKLKSVYAWRRISEKTLWILSSIGGVFGIWLGMNYPLYHKAGKRKFRLWVPLGALVWVCVIGLMVLLGEQVGIG